MHRFRGQFDDLQLLIKKHESTITAKQREIADLETQRAGSLKSQEAASIAITALQVHIDDLAAEVATQDLEKKEHSSVRQKLEKELDDLRKVMAAKSNEDFRRQEADKSREAEMTRLREQAASLQKALDDQRDTAAKMANQLRVDVEGLRQGHTTSQRDLKAAQALLKEKESELVRLQKEMDKVEQTKRVIDAELRTVKDHIGAMESKLQGALGAKDVGIGWARLAHAPC